jgi:hypothetical protein
VPAIISDEMSPGAVAVPHGWVHQGGWQLANSVGGLNSNMLTSDDLADVERLAGMSILSGIPVRIYAAEVPDSGAAADPVREPARSDAVR